MHQVDETNGEILSAFTKVAREVNALKYCVPEAPSVKDGRLASLGSLKQQVYEDGNHRPQPGDSTARGEADVDRMDSAFSRHGTSAQPTEEQPIKRAESPLIITNSKFQQITGLLRQIQEQTSSQSTEVTGCSNTRNTSYFAPMLNDSVSLFERAISCSFTRPCQSITRKPRSFNSAETQLVMNDLEQIILACERDLTKRLSKHGSQSRKRKWHDDEISKSQVSGEPAALSLARARKVLSASSKISVMAEVPHGTVQRGSRKYYSRRPHSYCQRSKHGTIMICCSTNSPDPSSYHSPLLRQNEASNEMNIVIENFEGNLTIIPSDGRCRCAVTISFLQQVTAQGSYIPNPKLFYRAMIPSDSKIFLAIRHSDLNKFLSLLHERQASLTDCDERGRSLLGAGSFISIRSSYHCCLEAK